jgi:ribosome recycling factor
MAKDKVLAAAEEKMKHSIDHARHEMTGIRTGKATPALLDTIKVDAYGTHMPLAQVALVSAPEPRLLVVQPFDKSLLQAIHKAIQAGDVGLNPNDDGNVLRIPIPALTEERRKELVKVAGKLIEDGRVSVRHARREAMDELKHLKKDGALSEDEERKLEKEMQSLTDRYVKNLDELLEKKTAEIMEV